VNAVELQTEILDRLGAGDGVCNWRRTWLWLAPRYLSPKPIPKHVPKPVSARRGIGN